MAQMAFERRNRGHGETVRALRAWRKRELGAHVLMPSACVMHGRARRRATETPDLESGPATALDGEVEKLSSRVSSLKHMSSDIREELQHRDQLVDQLEHAISRGSDAVRSVRTSLQRAQSKGGGWHLAALVAYCLALTVGLYLLSKISWLWSR